MKIVTWNAEWLDTYWGVVSGKYPPGKNLFPHKAPKKKVARARIDAVKVFLTRLDPDILFLCEAPAEEAEMVAFAAEVMPDHDVITRPSGEDYETGGRQWQWFLVRRSLSDQIRPSLLPIPIWRNFAAAGSSTIKEDGSWMVSIPRVRTVGGVKDVPVSERDDHSYFRHPQVLVFSFGGARHEIIGAHLKSKFVGRNPRKRKPDESFEEYAELVSVKRYLAKSHAARVKLSSEASNIRAYIDHRFMLEADPSIMVLGDLNDGPGKELMEREYLLHDLLSNLQGEVFFARRFLNHALFDAPGNLRWTARFKDLLDPHRDEHILLDHILFTQGMTRGGTGPLIATSRSGKVEHLLFEQVEAEVGKDMLSDHRPVSIDLQARVG